MSVLLHPAFPLRLSRQYRGGWQRSVTCNITEATNCADLNKECLFSGWRPRAQPTLNRLVEAAKVRDGTLFQCCPDPYLCLHVRLFGPDNYRPKVVAAVVAVVPFCLSHSCLSPLAIKT